jgi:cell wall-associated NlpC family hydrolase
MLRFGLALLGCVLASAAASQHEPRIPGFNAPVDEASEPPAPVRTAPAPDPRLSEVIFNALALMGTRYKFGGSSAVSGFDCSGFVRHVFLETTGLSLPRSAWEQARLGEPVAVHELAPGDLVFYNTLRRKFSHVGIYLGEGRFVHSPSRGKRVEIVSMQDAYWRNRYDGARRLTLSKPQE